MGKSKTTQALSRDQKAEARAASLPAEPSELLAVAKAATDAFDAAVMASDDASAANAVVDSVRSIVTPTPTGDWNSLCVCSDDSYGIEKGLITSFPIRSNGKTLEIVQGLPINEFSRGKINNTINELKEERAMVSELLGK